jgi:hypothetical protein
MSHMEIKNIISLLLEKEMRLPEYNGRLFLLW